MNGKTRNLHHNTSAKHHKLDEWQEAICKEITQGIRRVPEKGHANFRYRPNKLNNASVEMEIKCQMKFSVREYF